MPSPICVKCRLFFRPKKNGTVWEEMMPVNLNRTRDPIADSWVPYKLWESDLWECKGCGVEILVGHASRVFAEHFQPGYAQAKQAHSPVLSVTDC